MYAIPVVINQLRNKPENKLINKMKKSKNFCNYNVKVRQSKSQWMLEDTLLWIINKYSNKTFKFLECYQNCIPFHYKRGLIPVKDTVQNDAAFMQDGCTVSAVSTPTLFRCQMVCGVVKLNGLFAKESLCKGATTVVIPPRNGSDAFPGASGETLLQQTVNTLLTVLHVSSP